MKKTILFLLLAVFTVFSAKANPVDVNVARNVGAKFLSATAKVQLRGNDLQLAKTYNINRGDAAFYVFNAPNGFVIVAGDDCAYPILGYSDNGRLFDINNIPIQLQDILQEYQDQIQHAIENNLVADEKTAEQWRLVKATGKLSNNRDHTQVGPLLTTTWDQGQYYNAMCPEDADGPDGHCVTGCVATAMAQIIKYHGYPTSGRGTHRYQSDYGELSVNFEDSEYDYDNMPDALTSDSSQEEVNAVAKLISDCGVAVNMGYSAGESGSQDENVRTALINYFGFVPTLGYAERQMYTEMEWTDSLKVNIDRGEPVYYGGSNIFAGHAFVCDGYDQDDYFHFNFGWGGDSDGWFKTSAINAGSGFNADPSAIMGIRPDNKASTIICQEITGPCADEFIVTQPIDLRHLRGGSDYLAANNLLGRGIEINILPEDASGQLVLDVLGFAEGQSVAIFDGVNRDSLVRVIETREPAYASLYDGVPSDTLFQQLAGTDLSPIVSTHHGFTIITYSYGAMPEGFHLRVSDASECRMVSNLTAIEEETGTLLSWVENGDAIQWQVKVGETIYNCNEPEKLLTGLSPDVTYNVHVRAVCGGENYSAWNTIILNRRMYWTDVVKTRPEGYILDDDTIRITSAEGLAWVARCYDSLRVNNLNSYLYSMHVLSIENDLDMNGYLWQPIYEWHGNVEGNGHVIMHIKKTSSKYGGLFGALNDVTITDLGISNSTLCAGGSIAGSIHGCLISNCYVKDCRIVASNNGVSGGLFGQTYNSQILNCYVYADVYSEIGYGGIVGISYNSEIKNCVTQLGESFNWLSVNPSYKGLLTKEVHGGTYSNCFSDISIAKRSWDSSAGPEYEAMAKRAYFLGNVYNIDAIDNLAAFNIVVDPTGVLLTDTAVNYTLGENMDVITALNNKVVEYNSPNLRTWVMDSETHLPVFGDFYEVTCPNVSDIAAENIVYNDGFAVALSWHENGDAEEWQVKYNILNAPEESAIVITTNTTQNTLQGLQLGTEYVFYVRPLCGDVTVGWGQPFTFFVDKTLWIDMVTSCPDGYYEDSNGDVIISSPEGLAWLAKTGFDYRQNTVSIVSDIDMGAYKWTPIGRYSFEGTVEGYNHIISNIYCSEDMSNSNSTGTGLFGHANNASFKNIVVQNSSFSGNRYVGCIVGYSENCIIINCHTINNINKGQASVGGLGGLSTLGETYNCSSSGIIYSDLNEGGLFGCQNGTMTNCYSSCSIYPLGVDTRMYYGGLIGTAVGIVNNCYSFGNIEMDANDPFYSWGFYYGGTSIGYLSNVNITNTYASHSGSMPFAAIFEEGVSLSDTASLVNNTLQTPVTIAETSYTDLLDALNAWVDANNSNGEYLHWVADTNNENGGFPMLERMPATTAQISSFTEGWNWYSTYIEQDGADGLEMLENSLGHQGLTIKSYNDFTTNYYNDLGYDYWFGGLENLENEACYMIQTSSASGIVMTGRPAIPSEHPITIKPNWNWIGYPVANEHLASSAMGSFQPSNEDILKNHSDFATYYEGYGWFPEDFVMTPGKGYMYMSNANANKTLTYSAGREELPEIDEQEHQWTPEVHKYSDNMSVIAVVNLDGDEIRDGIEVGAFVNGECRGSAIMRYFEPTDRYYAMLSIVGEDGDIVNFKIIDDDSETKVAFNKNAVLGTLDNPYNLEFLSNRHEVSTLELFPNPVERSNEIEIIVPNYENAINVLIFNALGEIVRNEPFNGGHVSVPGQPGVYMVRINCDNGKVYYSKLIIK